MHKLEGLVSLDRKMENMSTDEGLKLQTGCEHMRVLV